MTEREKVEKGVTQVIKDDAAGYVHLMDRDRTRIAEAIVSYFCSQGLIHLEEDCMNSKRGERREKIAERTYTDWNKDPEYTWETLPEYRKQSYRDWVKDVLKV